jgi:hypothetical protein
MTENQKRLAIVGVVIIVALFFFMRGNDSNATTVVNEGSIIAGGGVESPSITIGARRPFVLPNFSGFASNNSLSAIGACCADCRPQTTSFRRDTSSGITFVTNRGDNGPNIYNYYTPAPYMPPSYIIGRAG